MSVLPQCCGYQPLGFKSAYKQSYQSCLQWLCLRSFFRPSKCTKEAKSSVNRSAHSESTELIYSCFCRHFIFFMRPKSSCLKKRINIDKRAFLSFHFFFFFGGGVLVFIITKTKMGLRSQVLVFEGLSFRNTPSPLDISVVAYGEVQMYFSMFVLTS